jgi:1-acyl-sn-glycerol-3-phosphate acyltransferase
MSSRAFGRFFPFSRTFVKILGFLLAPRFQVLGKRYVPHRGAVIITPNHASDSDPPFVANAVTRSLWFMAKRELFGIPFLGPMMSFYQAFPIDPSSPDREGLRRAEELLSQGSALVLFPEGRISRSGEMGEVLPGAVMLALRADVPVVPCGIWGTQHIVPYGSIIPRPTLRRVRLVFGPPLDFSDLKELPRRQARDEAARRLEDAIRHCREQAMRS